MNSSSIFKRALQIGEQILDYSYSDYEDAFLFSSKHFSTLSQHFIDHFMHHSNQRVGTYENSLIKYIFIKAAENRLSSNFYSNTSRGNVCDTFYSPFDITLYRYPTNLPKPLEAIINTLMPKAELLSKEIVRNMHLNGPQLIDEQILNAMQFLGHTAGQQCFDAHPSYKGVSFSEMLTRNELNLIAGHNLCKWMQAKGFEIENSNFSRDSYQNIIANQNGQTFHVLMSAEVFPSEPSFIPQDLDNLYREAHKVGAVPLYASISLGSSKQDHFEKGVLLYGDNVQYKINAFNELEKE